MVLDGATGVIGAGERVAILGPSGSGKSTLLNLASGIDLPDSGTVTIADVDVTALGERDRTLFRREHVGFVFQFFNLLPTLTVLENLLLPIELTGRVGEADRDRAQGLLDAVGLGDRADTFPDRLSGGEQQRIAIARALVHRPGLVLADEPTGNLDEDTGARVAELLDELVAAQQSTLVVVTHSRELAQRMDRVIRVDHGHLVEVTGVRLLTKSSLRYLLHHRTQLVLSIIGVALGVAVVLSIDVAIQSARAAFRVSAETVSGRATHQISSSVASIDEVLLPRLRTELGLDESAPIVEGFARSPLLAGQALRILGIDPFSEGPFRPFVAGGGPGLDVSSFLTTHTGVVLSAPTAVRAGIAAGDTLPVLVGGESWRLPVVGVLDPTDGLARAGLSDVLFMDISGAQDVLRMRGVLSRIDLRVPDTPSGADLLDRVRDVLAPGESLVAVGTRAETMSGMIAAFDVNLTALSLLALIFGMFLIYNSVTFSVVQRRALLGRLRAIGVTRAEILRLILAEAAWIGAAGAAIGTAVGLVLARGLLRLVTRTINDLYFTVSVEGVTLEPILVAKAAALGLGATLLAAGPPALEAAASRPRLAALRSVTEAKARRAVPRAAVLGAAMALLGTVVISASGRNLVLSFAAFFFIVAGLALATPFGTVALVGLFRPALRALGGTLGVMASRGVVTALSRTAPAIAALVVSVSVTVGLAS